MVFTIGTLSELLIWLLYRYEVSGVGHGRSLLVVCVCFLYVVHMVYVCVWMWCECVCVPRHKSNTNLNMVTGSMYWLPGLWHCMQGPVWMWVQDSNWCYHSLHPLHANPWRICISPKFVHMFCTENKKQSILATVCVCVCVYVHTKRPFLPMEYFSLFFFSNFVYCHWTTTIP